MHAKVGGERVRASVAFVLNLSSSSSSPPRSTRETTTDAEGSHSRRAAPRAVNRPTFRIFSPRRNSEAKTTKEPQQVSSASCLMYNELYRTLRLARLDTSLRVFKQARSPTPRAKPGNTTASAPPSAPSSFAGPSGRRSSLRRSLVRRSGGLTSLGRVREDERMVLAGRGERREEVRERWCAVRRGREGGRRWRCRCRYGRHRHCSGEGWEGRRRNGKRRTRGR